MILAMKRKNIFTEEDRELSKVLNADALGFQMVWTYFGQKIYHNKINSATFDIRNFNLNLFNHFVVYKLEQSDKLLLESNRENIEKILILLENLVVWSWKNEKEFDKTGLSGASNAEKKWKDKSINITLTSKRDELELIQNQHIYGINGRYKGSFISMKFFDSDYKYDETKMKEVENLINKNEELKKLYTKILYWLSGSSKVDDIPTKSYLAVFGKAQNDETSRYTKDFWLKNLGFDKDGAKIFYELVDVQNKEQNIQDLFSMASSKSGNQNFNHILTIEPILSYIEKLFEYILLLDTHNVSEVPLKYFQPIIDFDFEQFKLDNSSSVGLRLKDLAKSIDVKSLVDYHSKLMYQRDKLPWIEIKDDKIKVLMIKQGDINLYTKYLDEKKDDLKSISWVHDYYKGTIRRIKEGLES